MANHYTRDQNFFQLFEYDFGLSEEESSGKEAEGTYTYFISQVVDPDAVSALWNTASLSTVSLALLE